MTAPRINDSINEYQNQAVVTAVYPGSMTGGIVQLMYLGLGAAGELGEVTEIIKKIFRKNLTDIPPDQKDKLAGEIGDVFWYLNMLCSELGIDTADVLQANVQKLARRGEEGKLDALAGERAQGE